MEGPRHAAVLERQAQFEPMDSGRDDRHERADADRARQALHAPPQPRAGGRARLACAPAHRGPRRREAGLAAADEALEMGGGAQLWEAEARRLRAEFLAGLGPARREIETAERQGARSFELRARESRDRFRAGTL
jgi:hypothetical protein